MQDIESAWDTYRTSLKDLEDYEEKTKQKKRDIIISIRDSVASLVRMKLLHIQKDEIAIYVRNLLYDRHITISRSYFLSLFSEDQKRNYSTSSAESFHTHDWQISLENTAYKLESCTCGSIKVNDILQQAVTEDPDGISKSTITEDIPPEGVEFQVLEKYLEISQNNVLGLRRLISKLTLHKSTIEKQAKKCVGITAKEKIINEEKAVKERQKVVQTEIKKLGSVKKLLEVANTTIKHQKQALRYFNGRVSLLSYEKIMAKFAVYLGWDKGDIASFLAITTKHMKVNILRQGSRKSLLTELEWFGRCPNPDCGIILKDYFEDKLEEYEKKNQVSIADEDYEIEMLQASGYQKQVLELQKQIKRLERRLK